MGERWQLYPRFCCKPPSLSPRCGGRSWPAGCYPASPLRRRCEQAGWCERPKAPTDKPAPRTLLPIGQRSRLAADIAADAGEAITSPFQPLPGQARRDCSLLPSCVAGGLRRPRPRLRFRGVAFRIENAELRMQKEDGAVFFLPSAFCLRSGGESGSSSGFRPAAARRQRPIPTHYSMPRGAAAEYGVCYLQPRAPRRVYTQRSVAFTLPC